MSNTDLASLIDLTVPVSRDTALVILRASKQVAPDQFREMVRVLQTNPTIRDSEARFCVLSHHFESIEVLSDDQLAQVGLQRIQKTEKTGRDIGW